MVSEREIVTKHQVSNFSAIS